MSNGCLSFAARWISTQMIYIIALSLRLHFNCDCVIAKSTIFNVLFTVKNIMMQMISERKRSIKTTATGTRLNCACRHLTQSIFIGLTLSIMFANFVCLYFCSATGEILGWIIRWSRAAISSKANATFPFGSNDCCCCFNQISLHEKSDEIPA